MRYRYLALLASLFICLESSAANLELTPQNKRLMGGCASLGFKIFNSKSLFPEEWRQLAPRLIVMPLIITPSLKEDLDFQEGWDKAEKSLADPTPSAETLAYAKAFHICLKWVDIFLKRDAR
jgi:hypothetical protein